MDAERGLVARLLRSTLRVLLVLCVVALAYLVAWPVPIDPVAWEAPAAPPLTGPYAPNDRLMGVERIGQGIALAPEGTAVDRDGRVFTGTRDGRILRFTPGTGELVEVARTGGRPLGMAFDRQGRLLVCDSPRGLLALEPSGEMKTLATGDEGVPFACANDVDVAPDGTVYFSDASSHLGIGSVRDEILAHRGTGRLLRYTPGTRKTELLLGGLQFANGVAVSGDGSFVVVNETGAYRMRRFWLAGPKRGTSELFVDNLPGLPDNVTYSPARRAFWVALFSPRVPALDLLAPYPFLRKVVARLPLWMQPQPARHAWALAVDEDGKVVESLQDPSPDSFSPVASVRESGGSLWLGSLERDALGRIAAPPLPGATR